MKQIVDFVENIIENIVIVKPFEFCNKKENIIEDARSAAFYALAWRCEKKKQLFYLFLENISQTFIQRLLRRGFKKQIL